MPVTGSPFLAGSPTGAVVTHAAKFAYFGNEAGNSVSGYRVNPTSGAITPVAGSPFAAGSAPFAIAACRRAGSVCKPPPF